MVDVVNTHQMNSSHHIIESRNDHISTRNRRTTNMA